MNFSIFLKIVLALDLKSDYSLAMSLDQLATPDSAELLVMFNSAADQAQAAWEEQETEEDRARRALSQAKFDLWFSTLPQ